MTLLNTYTYEIKHSKFIAYYYDVKKIEEINEILTTLKKEHKKAKHFPYAYKINQWVKKSDDKEPSNTAGTPIYNQIESHELNNCLIVVVRYFGGIKLGSGPLLRSYLHATKEVIKNT